MRIYSVLSLLAVLAVSLLYCLPHHPSAGGQVSLDVVLHTGLFLGLAALLAPLGHRLRVLSALAVLGVVLEIVQWQLGGYAALEWGDVIANEAGVALAALVIQIILNGGVQR